MVGWKTKEKLSTNELCRYYKMANTTQVNERVREHINETAEILRVDYLKTTLN